MHHCFRILICFSSCCMMERFQIFPFSYEGLRYMSSVFIRIRIRTVVFSRYFEDLAIWEMILGNLDSRVNCVLLCE